MCSSKSTEYFILLQETGKSIHCGHQPIKLLRFGVFYTYFIKHKLYLCTGLQLSTNPISHIVSGHSIALNPDGQRSVDVFDELKKKGQI